MNKYSKVLPFVIAFLLFVTCVGAVSVVNYYTPIPDSTINDSRTIDFKFRLDERQETCYIVVSLTNGTVFGNVNSTENTLAVDLNETNNRTYNYSLDVEIDSALGNSHNWSIYCNDTGDSGNASLITTKNFYVDLITPEVSTPTNNTAISTNTTAFNINTNVGVGVSGMCQYSVNMSNGTNTYWTNLTNTSAYVWVNDSEIYLQDSHYGKPNNFSFRCNDSNDEYYESNTYYLYVDTINPATITSFNMSESSSTVTLNNSFIDNTTCTCEANVYDRFGTLKDTLTGTVSQSNTTGYCSYSLTGDVIASDGAFQVEYVVTDSASNVGYVSSNQTGVMKILYEGWNVLSYPDGMKNLSSICGMVSGCTKVSYYDNTGKAFSTYSTSTPTVNDEIEVNISDAIMIYVSADTYFVSDDYLSLDEGEENITITSGWNLVGLLYNTTLNQTYAQNPSNISFIATYDEENSLFYTCKGNTSKCAGTTSNSEQIEIPKGTAVWVRAYDTYSLNRTGVN